LLSGRGLYIGKYPLPRGGSREKCHPLSCGGKYEKWKRKRGEMQDKKEEGERKKKKGERKLENKK
jgi:hypothetical protein